MFQTLMCSSRRVLNNIKRTNVTDPTLSSIFNLKNSSASKSSQSIFPRSYIRTGYHTSIFTEKSSKKKKSRKDEDDTVVELGRYEPNEQGEWVRRVVSSKKRTAVLSPQLEADINDVLAQDLDDLDNERPKHSPRDSAPTAMKTKTEKKTKGVKAQSAGVKNKSAPDVKAKSVTNVKVQKTGVKSTSATDGKETPYKLSKEEKAVLNKYSDLLDESDFAPVEHREIRAPTLSGEETEKMVERVVNWLREEKMADVCAIDLRPKTDWSRFMVIATAKSERHNRAAAEVVAQKMGQLRGNKYSVQSGGEDNWLIVFTEDIVIELFTEERRKFYDIERLWVLKRSFEEELNIDPDDLQRFQYDEEDGMFDDELLAKIRHERRERGEPIDEPELVMDTDEPVTPVIPYSTSDKQAKKKKKKGR